MPVLGITGGIATGKSTFVRSLTRHLPGEVFDADAAARELLESDPGVRKGVTAAFGPRAWLADGTPDRRFLRETAFADSASRQRLESILHPAIRARWIALAAAAGQGSRWLFVDIPLLYETAAESYFTRVVVVACSPAVQRRRLLTERGLSEEISENIIGAQHDLRLKSARADHVIWNDSTAACLDGQAVMLTRWLSQYYG